MDVPTHADKLYIWFLDVGQGDGTFIRFPDGRSMLIDLGSNKLGSNPKEKARLLQDMLNAFKTIETFFEEEDRFIRDKLIDFLLLTHPDKDHYNLLPLLLDEGYSFESVLYSRNFKEYKSGPKFEKLLKLKGKNFLDWLKEKVESGSASASQLNAINGIYQWQSFPGGYFHLLCSGFLEEEKEPNTSSIVVMIEYRGIKALLSGDATFETENQIIKNVKSWPGGHKFLKCDILKLGHHGSARTSISQEWAEATSPRCIFISADRTGVASEDEASGHRLPQLAAIDTILQFAPGALPEDMDGKPHTFMAYYDQDTGKIYGQSRSVSKFNRMEKNPDAQLQDIFLKDIPDGKKPYGHYIELLTKRQIYTSVFRLGKADLGTPYGVIIDSSGYKVLPWSKDFDDIGVWVKSEVFRYAHDGVAPMDDSGD